MKTFLIIVLLFFQVECFASSNGTKIKYGLSWILGKQYAGEIIAESQNKYKQANVDIELVPYTPVRSSIVEAVANGEVDIGEGEVSSILRGYI